MNKVVIEFTFVEIEVLLLSIEPRHLQKLGPHFDSAKAKLLKARREIEKPEPVKDQVQLVSS